MNNENKKYKIGIYVRESRDDSDGYSDTIETQIGLLVDFLKKTSIGELYKIYVDNNVSGTVFDREGINELKQDIINGNITLLLIKDLSRLGRNNAKTLIFLDFLEEHGVRVITYDGRYDSLRDNDTVGIDTWYNERYVKDISKKIKSSLRYKINNGEFLGQPPYGYVKSKSRKNSLEVDNEAAQVVKMIFDLFCKGYGCGYIANYLNEKGYVAPAVKKGRRSGKWNAATVYRILGNRVYLGDTVQGVSEKVSYKSKKTRRLPSDMWVITPHTHEAIIDCETFDKAAKIRLLRKRGANSHKGIIHAFKDVLFCARCGSVMYARKRGDKSMGYICSKYANGGSSICSSHYISESELETALKEEILKIFEICKNKNEYKKIIESIAVDRCNIEKEIKNIALLIDKKIRNQDMLYMDRLSGKISEELFVRINSRLDEEIKKLLNEYGQLKRIKEENKLEDIFDQIKKKINAGHIENSVVKAIVDKILVFDENDIKNCNDINDYEIIKECKNITSKKGVIHIYFKHVECFNSLT